MSREKLARNRRFFLKAFCPACFSEKIKNFNSRFAIVNRKGLVDFTVKLVQTTVDAKQNARNCQVMCD